MEVIDEAEHMARFELAVPDFVQIITFCKKTIFFSYEKVKSLVDQYNELR